VLPASALPARPQARLPLVPQGSGTLGLGSYEFPFELALPPGLPGSARFESGDARAYIDYKIKAVVDQAGLGAGAGVFGEGGGMAGEVAGGRARGPHMSTRA
jgi:hypothetical protein